MQNRFLIVHYTHFKKHHRKVFKKYNFSNEGAKFFYNVSLAFGFNSYVPRDGVWATPWDGDLVLHDQHQMPDPDPNFSKSFEQITDEAARDIALRIRTNDEKFLILYSGGIDSTTIVAALIKNLTTQELENITISMSLDSIIENEYFYTHFIKDKIKVHDSHEFDMKLTVSKGYTVIVGDQGDAMFGTELGTKLYPLIPHYNDYSRKGRYLHENVATTKAHYTEYKDAIIKYFNACFDSRYYKLHNTDKTSFDEKFGEIYYNKLIKNIESSKQEIYSLHDFFWWIIFNTKYMHCAMRPGGIQSTGVDRKFIFKKTLNWFASKDYQLWSMANNNNGEKIDGHTQGKYKMAAKKYIYDVDKNDWYLYYKMKIPSKQIIVNRHRPELDDEMDIMFGIDEDYQMIYYNNPGVEEYFYEKLKNYDG